MLKGGRFQDELTPIEGIRLESNNRLCLLIIGDGFVSTYPLPESGDLIIGRAEDADIPIDVASVSRRHALLHVGSTICIEDLGRANGTFINETRLQRGRAATLGPGAMFELGSTMLILQDSHTASRPRRIWTHGYFEARLEDECARAERSGGSFSLLRIRAENKQAKTAAMHELLLSTLRPGDILASYGPDDYEVLIVDATPNESRQVIERLERRLEQKGAAIRTGCASYPHDGRAPELLMAHACAQVDAGVGDVTAGGIIIESGVMKSLHKLAERVAASDINVLILGETGVGKEVFAERIHALSPRAAGPLLRLNCTALSDTLLESELFGHERGAFTGATAAKPGLLETASGGTVFLDEIGDMPLALQAKLLRVLEQRCVRRVGGIENRPIDIRIVAATHRDLESEVQRDRFRQDLFFRINGISLVVPPLRDRREEIEPLARTFIEAARKRQRVGPIELSDKALRAMQRYEWPGNIRELRNVIERAVLLCTDGVLTLVHLPSDKMASTFEMMKMKLDYSPPPQPPTPPRAREAPEPVDLKTGIQQRERELIRDALERAGGNQTRAAKLLGISRRTLITRIEQHGLPRPRKNKRR